MSAEALVSIAPGFKCNPKKDGKDYCFSTTGKYEWDRGTNSPPLLETIAGERTTGWSFEFQDGDLDSVSISLPRSALDSVVNASRAKYGSETLRENSSGKNGRGETLEIVSLTWPFGEELIRITYDRINLSMRLTSKNSDERFKQEQESNSKKALKDL